MNEKKFTDSSKLSEILRFYNMKIVELNTKIGAKNRELYQISAGNQMEFSRDMLKAIAKKCPEISLYWLITGEGSMLAGTIEQHNVNGNNIGQQNNHTENADLTSVVASQQATIAKQADTIATLAAKI